MAEHSEIKLKMTFLTPEWHWLMFVSRHLREDVSGGAYKKTLLSFFDKSLKAR